MTDSTIPAGPPAAEPASAAGAPAEERIVFRGTTSEYFGIWFVNVMLNLVTLGIYSAWAKVRRLRYFYGNTWLGGHSFDYVANPVAILKGRLIVVAMLGAYIAVGYWNPFAQLACSVAFLPVYPWMINRSLGFASRMTIYRNVRFRWRGTYWGAVKAYLLWPIVGFVSFGMAMPVVTRAQAMFIARNHSYGDADFTGDMDIGEVYVAFFSAALIATALSVALMGLIVGGVVTALFTTTRMDFDPQTPPAIMAIIIGVAAYALLISIYFAIGSFYRGRVRNLILNGLALHGGHKFRGTISGRRFAWINFSNLIAIIFTLGLLRPWAAIRLWRYQCNNAHVTPGPNLDSFVDVQARNEQAFAQEFAEFEGFDFGI